MVGVCRMVLEFAFPPSRCGVEDSAPAVLRGVHYLHFAILLCGLTAIVVAVVSLLTPPPTHEQVCTHGYNKQHDYEGSKLMQVWSVSGEENTLSLQRIRQTRTHL